MSTNKIFITGIERSGSSLVANIFKMCGAFTGTTTEMCENVNIRAIMNDYYKRRGADPRGQWPLPENIQIENSFGRRVESAIKKEGCSGTWLYKSSRIGQTYKQWFASFPEGKYIIVRRRTGDVINSCMKTGYMNAFSRPEDWKKWIHYHENLFIEMLKSGKEVYTMWPHRITEGNYDELKEILSACSLEFNDVAKNYIEDKLISWNKKNNMTYGDKN